MKSALTLFLVLTALPLLHLRAEQPGKLAVHEWGTFTVLSGSDGLPLSWHQSTALRDDLPPFVQISPFGAKADLGSLGSVVRMETPVIYFYPDKPGSIQVSAQLLGGSLTEWFPATKSLPQPAMLPPAMMSMATAGSLPMAFPLSALQQPAVLWEGKLLPPNDPEALSQIPAVSPGAGEHYGQARNVPEAWIFRSSTAAKHSEEDPAKGKDAEKFIFYRGKGQTPPPYSVDAKEDGTVRLGHRSRGEGINAAFAIRVEKNAAAWTRLPELPAAPQGNAAPVPEGVTARLDAPSIPLEEAAKQLTVAMVEALASADLTLPEAAAMVATWDGHWFREPGTRVLALMPQKWIDSVLPLSIKPQPTELTRVFVTRFEVLTPERESALLSILGSEPNEKQSARLQELKLGRFTQGAVQRVTNMEVQRIRTNFEKLRQMSLPPAVKK